MFDYAMDLGTSSVLLYREGKGIVLREPSVVAMRRSSGSVVGAGQKARNMLGRTPEDLLAVRPVRGGVITDCSIAGAMTKIFLKRAGCGGFLRPNLLVCVPPLVSELEERAVIDAGMQAGASRVYLMEQPVAAAAGAGVDPDSPKGTLVIDIGGGTTDLAVISLGAVVCAASIRIAGDSCDDAIQAYVKQQHDLLIGISAAEQIQTDHRQRVAERRAVFGAGARTARIYRAARLRNRDVRRIDAAFAGTGGAHPASRVCAAGAHAAGAGRRFDGDRHGTGGRRIQAVRHGGVSFAIAGAGGAYIGRAGNLRDSRHAPHPEPAEAIA